jgi:hypothetical protein
MHWIPNPFKISPQQRAKIVTGRVPTVHPLPKPVPLAPRKRLAHNSISKLLDPFCFTNGIIMVKIITIAGWIIIIPFC